MSVTVYAGLGSNSGDSPALLLRALDLLAEIPGLAARAVSPVYITEPQGDKDQPWFHNQVAELVCSNGISPLAILESFQVVEKRLGRMRDPARRFGPRCMDIDFLLYDNLVLQNERLTLPHPRMRARAFVLLPLHDLAPDLKFPDGQSLAGALAALDFHREGVRIFQP